MSTCTDCNGKGKIELFTSIKECETCNGTGTKITSIYFDILEKSYPPLPVGDLSFPNRRILKNKDEIMAVHGAMKFKKEVADTPFNKHFTNAIKEEPISNVAKAGAEFLKDKMSSKKITCEKPPSYDHDVAHNEMAKIDYTMRNYGLYKGVDYHHNDNTCTIYFTDGIKVTIPKGLGYERLLNTVRQERFKAAGVFNEQEMVSRNDLKNLARNPRTAPIPLDLRTMNITYNAADRTSAATFEMMDGSVLFMDRTGNMVLKKRRD